MDPVVDGSPVYIEVEQGPSHIEIMPVPGLPGPSGTSGAGVLFTQTVAQATIPLQHNLHRDGPISVAAYSLDYSIQYDGYVIQPVNRDLALFVSDDPITGHFLVL